MSEPCVHGRGLAPSPPQPGQGKEAPVREACRGLRNKDGVREGIGNVPRQPGLHIDKSSEEQLVF